MRKRLFKWHSSLAMFALIPIFIVCVTGSVLVFKVELDTWLRPHHMLVAEPPIHSARTSENTVSVGANPDSRMPLDTLMANVSSANPDYLLAGWELFYGQERTDTAYVIKRDTDTWYKIYIDQYSGELLSKPQDMHHYITDWLLELHYAFLLGFSGTVVGVFIALIMFFLGVSGIILYRKFWAKLFTLRWQAARRILFSDIHKMVGILASPIFLLIAFTGGYWNISIIYHELSEHGLGDEHHVMSEVMHNETINFDILRLDSQQQIESFIPNYLAIPNEDDMDIMFFGEVATTNPLLSQYGSMLVYDHNTGELKTKYDIRSAGVLQKFDDSTRKLHFGYFAGIWSKIVWCIIGLAPVILMVTGTLMFIIRRNPKTRLNKRNMSVLNHDSSKDDFIEFESTHCKRSK